MQQLTLGALSPLETDSKSVIQLEPMPEPKGKRVQPSLAAEHASSTEGSSTEGRATEHARATESRATESRATESAAVNTHATAGHLKSRRVLAIVLPQLLCELALSRGGPMGKSPSSNGAPSREALLDKSSAFAVVVLEGAQPGRQGQLFDIGHELESKTHLAAVSNKAHSYGVRAGQSITEAKALVSQLKVVVLTQEQVRKALERVAEGVLKYAATVSFSLAEPTSASPASRGGTPKSKRERQAKELFEIKDTVWLEITGSSHLFGGEQALCEEIQQAVQQLGHLCRLAIANGPVLARAFAHWQGRGLPRIVKQEQVSLAVKSLPILALPVEPKVRSWLIRLGLLTFEELAKVPAKLAASRLGGRAQWVLGLLQGEDVQPMNPYHPLTLPQEEQEWEEPLVGSEPLLFVLRGLCSKVAARLEGRGLAAQNLQLIIVHDKGIAQLRKVKAQKRLNYELAAPLYRSEELFKVLSARLSRVQLGAPSVGLSLEVRAVTSAHKQQLELSRAQSQVDADNTEALAVLFGELASDIGRHRFGTLKLMDSHRPEKLSLLSVVALHQGNQAKVSKGRASQALEHPAIQLHSEAPSRLFKKPVSVSAPFKKGGMMPLGCHLYTIQGVQFERRLEGVEWWSKTPVSRDYVRLRLQNQETSLEVLAYVDRTTDRRYVQGIYD